MNLIFFAHIVALLFSFFVVGALLGVAFSKPLREKVIEFVTGRRDLLLARLVNNPILSPGLYPWAAEAVMNPAAAIVQGRTHLLYRAIGMDGVSRLGYASSANGIVFDDRPAYPAFISQRPREGFQGPKRYSPVIYPSGGSWGGAEDPRMVALDGRIYVTFNMFDGWDFIRVAFISIAEEDFLAKRFYKWSEPQLISPPGQIHKNWVLFPEKINGRFAILHSIVPNIEIAYRGSLDAIGTSEPFIESWAGPRGTSGSGGWDSLMRGAGPPPIKTKRGWLLLYHAIDRREPSRYKLGAMLLDLTNPSKILGRAPHPVLVPDEPYENNGKPGIVYACGATVKNDMLYVYYGGADKVVCVATAPLTPFIDALENGGSAALKARTPLALTAP